MAEPDSSLDAPLLASHQNDDVEKRERRFPLDLSRSPLPPYSPNSNAGSEDSDPERVRSGDAASSPNLASGGGVLAPGTLSFKAGVAICVADIIGSGIFASPGIVLRWTGSVGAALGAWFFAGLITYVGFACLAELSVLDPNAGGIFYYCRVAFGGATAFSWTFVNFTVIVPGSLGALALTFAHYLCSTVPGWEAGGFEAAADWKVRAVACAAIAAAAALNCLSAAHGGGVAKVFLTATLSGCLFVFALGVVGFCGWGNASGYDEFGNDTGNGMHATDTWASNTTATNTTANATAPHSVAYQNFNDPFAGTNSVSSLGVGLIAALWAFSGAMDVASMGEELVSPQKTLPRVGKTGLAIVSAAYILLNVAYLLVLPARVMANGTNGAMGVSFARAVAGGWAGAAVTVVVAVSSFGALNSCMYLSARQFYATARDGLFPEILARTNSRKAPHVAILATALWTSVLTCVMSSFAVLVNYLSCAMWLFYGLVGVAVFKSRHENPDVYRPYKVPGYPLVPALYVGACVFLSASTFFAAPAQCFLALLFVALAFPVHRTTFVWWPERAARLNIPVQDGGASGGGEPRLRVWSDADDDEF